MRCACLDMCKKILGRGVFSVRRLSTGTLLDVKIDRERVDQSHTQNKRGT